MEQDPFKEYIKETEPEKRDKGYAWHTAIGLQAVDGLRPSKYLIDTAIKNIEGDISIDEAGELLNSYYEENPKSDATDRAEEADKVSLRIVKIVSEKAFSFTPNEYISIHRKLFTGIYSHAGRIRDYNITKKEWVLNGATVMYGSASELRATLEYDFSEEKKFSYKNLNMDQIIHHLAVFVSRLWQIHIFAEGKADIGEEKADIAIKIANIDEAINSKTRSNILALYQYCGKETFFGRTVVESVTGLKSTRASEVLQLLLRNNIIEKVQGHGKGKYRFL
ncbi:Fic family protein [Coprococcus sp. CLA-AA-H212]|uniref:protein adenylyltransferase n=1 Tax=Coprococcus hominis (ex Arizal et al. 2022) TaxID=2881262 RepID=A0ABS8FQQ9_9FIRM|nr:Fic family protein [Coprococcus hominis (ex Arizal et al. 2022)]MCC2219505.1 Fic family protein [Coprococcus hominis (ex Arizal et al. 2022)]